MTTTEMYEDIGNIKFTKSTCENYLINFTIEKERFNFRSGSSFCYSFPNEEDNSDFKWEIYFKRIDDDQCSMNLYSIGKKLHIPVIVFFGFCIGDGIKTIMRDRVEYIFDKNSLYTHKKLLKLSKLDVEFITFNAKVSAQYEPNTGVTNLQSQQILLNNFSNLLISDVFSDIILHTKKDGIDFKVHRNILSCRSKVFAAMLSNDMLENATKRIVIDDFSSSAIRDFLDYLYCCKIEFTNLNAVYNLLALSEKYDVVDLKFQCAEYLSTHLNENNAFHIILQADLYRLSDLKDTVLQYISKNKHIFSDMTKLKILEKNPKLQSEIIFKLLKN